MPRNGNQRANKYNYNTNMQWITSLTLGILCGDQMSHYMRFA